MKVKSIIKIAVSVIVIALITTWAVAGFNFSNPFTKTSVSYNSVFDVETGIKRGNGFAMGTEFTLTSEKEMSAEDMKTVISMLKGRAETLGYTSATVSKIDSKTVKVSVPETEYQESMGAAFAATNELFFKNDAGDVLLNGKEDIKNASYAYDSASSAHMVVVNFTEAGRSKFYNATAQAAEAGGSNIAMLLDDNQIVSSQVSEPMDTDQCVFSGNYSKESAMSVIGQINNGPLPVVLTLSATKTVFPAFGDAGFTVALCIIGGIILAVILLMIITNRLAGVMAGISYIGFTAIYAMVLAGDLFGKRPEFGLLTAVGVLLSVLAVGAQNIYITSQISKSIKDGRGALATIGTIRSRGTWKMLVPSAALLLVAIVLYCINKAAMLDLAYVLIIGALLGIAMTYIFTPFIINALAGFGVESKSVSFE